MITNICSYCWAVIRKETGDSIFQEEPIENRKTMDTEFHTALSSIKFDFWRKFEPYWSGRWFHHTWQREINISQPSQLLFSEINEQIGMKIIW